MKLGKFDEAIKHYKKLSETYRDGPEYELIVIGWAECLSGLGRGEEQVALLEKAAASNIDFPHAKIALAYAFSQFGEFDRARDLYHSVLAQHKNSVGAYQGLGEITKWQSGDPLIKQAEDLYERGGLGKADKISLAFTLAKMFSDTKQDSHVFAYLDFANAELRRNFSYSTEDVRADFAAMMENYSPEFFESLKKYANKDATPIFILGLPRSGTTLTEQIISSHPDVAAGGELSSASHNFFMALTNEQGDILGADQIDATALEGAAKTCIEILRERFPDSLHVTDKLPHTFVVVGFLLTLLPNAKIVHVSRNPVDNCLSIYKNQFDENAHRYSNNLRELGDYYGMYAALMDHWRAMFPGQIIEARYDEIVADPDAKIRELIAALGLAWDDACLNSQSNAREIKTLSLYQARQPIYKSSSRGWKKYEAELTDLTDSLREAGVAFD